MTMTTRKNIITLAGGGSTLAPNIVRGGKAIDLGNNFYYIKGRKHKNGGVDVGENAKTGLEVEGEEVMQVKPNEVRVFSSVPFLRGVSPAELVMNGNNPDAVFNAQERFKDINKINDDGTKAKYGKSKINNNMIASINGNIKNGLIHTEMKCGGRRTAKYGKDGISTALSNRGKIQYDLNDLKRRLGIIKSGKYKGGGFGGAGAGSNIDNYKEPRIIEKTDTIYTPVTTTFNDAFRKAIIDGEPEFEFNGKKYTTEIGDDPRWKEYGDKRTSTVIVPIERKRKIKTYNDNTIMRYGGRRKAKYGRYDNMLGLGRADYNIKSDIESQIRNILDNTNEDFNRIKNIKIDTNTYNTANLEKDLTDKEKEDIVKSIINKERHYAKGNVEIVSPEFNAMFLAKGLASGAGSEIIGLLKSGYNLARNVSKKSNNKTKENDLDFGEPIDKNVDKYVTKRIPKRRARKYNIKEKPTKTIEMPDITINQDNSGLFYGRKINNPNLKFTRRIMDAKTSRELDKIYDKVIGNKPPRSGFEFKYQPTEIPYAPSTNDIGRIYDAAAEWNKYFGKRLYKDYVTKYGKKGVNKALKKEGISVYKYGGRKKADLGLSYYAKNLFGPKYDKVIDLNSDGTREERNLIYADATNPNKSFTDILLSGDVDNYSSMGSFNNRRIEGYRNITPDIKVPNISTAVTTKTSTPADYSTPVQSTLPVEDKSIPDYVSRTSLADTLKIGDNLDLTPKITKGLSIKSYPSFTGSRQQSRTSNWWNDDNLDKINLYTNIGASATDFITNAILNSQLPTISLPTMTAPTLSALPEIKLADIKEIEAPKTVAAAKLKTRHNVNAQLSKIEDETRRSIDDVDRNTADSRTAIARKQRIRNDSQKAKNEIYTQKENIETNLINKDKLNAQTVTQGNVNNYNNYLAAKAQQAIGKAQLQMMVDKANIGNKLAVNQFNANAKLTADQFNTNNKIKEILGNNAIETTKLNNYAQGVSNLLGNIGGSIDTFTKNSMSRKRDAEALRALRARYKDIPDEILNYIIRG